MKIYFSWSIKGGDQTKAFYPEIIRLLQKYGTVVTEHIGAMVLDPQKNIAHTPQWVFNTDKSLLDQSDIVIAEISSPSLWVGWEIAYAQYVRGIPIFALYKEEFRPSWMITGNDYIQVFSRENIENLKQNILPQIFKA